MVTSLRKSSSTIELPLTKIQQTRSSLDTPYTPILENLKNQISELVNPFLADDINTVFEQIGSTPSLDPKEGIKPLFNTVPLPKEIDNGLTQLDTLVQDFLNPGASTDEILKQITHFQSQISDLYKQNDQIIKEKTSKFIKEKKILYQIPEIKKIHSVAMRAIDNILSTKIDLPMNRKKVKRLINKEIANIDDLISKNTKGTYPDLHRIVIPILQNNKPSIKLPDEKIRQSYLHNDIKMLKEKIIQNKGKYFEVFFENLVANDLKAIDNELIENSDLKRDLEDIHLNYKKHPNNNLTINDLLIQIIQDINFSEVLEDRKCIELFGATKLIEQASQGIKKVKGRGITLLIGNTGAGKSTFAGYLLGAKIKLENNKAVYEKGQDISSLPEMIHAKAISGTSFPTGFTKKEYPEWVIVDCPGFLDTRGVKHLIATYFAIESLSSLNACIKSVVIVVKASDFESRPSKFLDIVKNTRTFFDFAFKKNNENSNIFVLVTHNEDENLEYLCEKISTGSLYQTYIDELKEQITKQPDKVSDYLDQIEIWESLKDMAKNNQVDFIDIEQTIEANDFIEKYQCTKEKPVCINRSESDQDLFKVTLTLSIIGWTERIYRPFYIEIPSSNDFNNNQIEKRQSEKIDFISTNEKLNNKITQKKKQKFKLKKIKTLFEALKTEKTDNINDFKSQIKILRMKKSELEKEKQKLEDESKNNIQREKQSLNASIQSWEKTKKIVDDHIEGNIYKYSSKIRNSALATVKLLYDNIPDQSNTNWKSNTNWIRDLISNKNQLSTKLFKLVTNKDTHYIKNLSLIFQHISEVTPIYIKGALSMVLLPSLHCSGVDLASFTQNYLIEKKKIKLLVLEKKLITNKLQVEQLADDINFNEIQTKKANIRMRRAKNDLANLKKLKNSTILRKKNFLRRCNKRDIKQYHDQIEENNKDMSEIELKIKNLQEINEQKQKKLKQIAFFVCQNKELLDCTKNFSQKAIDLYKDTKTYEDFNHLCNKLYPNLVNDAEKILKVT